MPGSAVMGANLVDEMVVVADEIRADLHPALGVRQFRVYTVQRTWSGLAIGEGDPTDVETEITPQPLVLAWNLENKLEPCGLDEDGDVELREVSLTYTEAQLTGGALEMNQQWLVKLTDAHGQAVAARYYYIDAPPFPDRAKDIGWRVRLRRAQEPSA